jgi:hypothetical protein
MKSHELKRRCRRANPMYGLRGAGCVQDEIHRQRASGGVEADVFSAEDSVEPGGP